MPYRYFSFLVVLLACFALVSGCAQIDNLNKFDREADLQPQDVRDAFAPREIPSGVSASEMEAGGTNVPEFNDYTSTSIDGLKPMPLVTVSVNETVPLKDVLYELARQANYDIELDPAIDGSIIFSATNRPFDEVMERIADLAGLRYKLKDNVVRLEIDTPYSKVYKVSYLNMSRTASSSISSSAGGSGSSSGATATTSSSFSVTGNTSVDFWADFESNLKDILVKNAASVNLRSGTSTASFVTAPPPAPVSTQGATAVTTPTIPVSATAPSAAPAASSSAASTPASTSSSASSGGDYSLNKQAGLVTVYATEKVHRKVRDYIDTVNKQVGTQVLIEAKVLEVSLTDEYSTGINWSEINLRNLAWDKAGIFNNFEPEISFPSPSMDPTTTNNFAIGINSGRIDAIMSAINRFGTIQALASPRMTVLNNQSAILNVVRNQTYFEIKVEKEDATTENPTPETTVTSTPKTAPEGVMMNVTPSIDTETGQITMTVRPTISKIDGTVADPGASIAAAQAGLDGLESLVPNVSVQEFDSVVKMKSGEIVVMGGLLRDKRNSEREGTPILSETPILGSLFRNHGDKIEKVELVVMLRATILNDASESIHQTDRDLYRTFGQDRRPFPM